MPNNAEAARSTLHSSVLSPSSSPYIGYNSSRQPSNIFHCFDSCKARAVWAKMALLAASARGEEGARSESGKERASERVRASWSITQESRREVEEVKRTSSKV